MTQAMTNRASGRSFHIGAKETAQAQVPEGRDKGFPFGATRPKTARTAGRMSSPSPPPRHRLPSLQAKTTFCQDRSVLVFPLKWPLWDSLPA